MKAKSYYYCLLDVDVDLLRAISSLREFMIVSGEFDNLSDNSKDSLNRSVLLLNSIHEYIRKTVSPKNGTCPR